MFKISGYLNRGVDEVSGGQLHRVLIVRALITDPEIGSIYPGSKILNDDLSNELYRSFIDFCKKNGKTVLIASHDLKMKGFVDRVVDLNRQKGVIRNK